MSNNPKKLLIIGAGGHGKVVADAAQAMATWEKIAFLDQRFPQINAIHSFPILGTNQLATQLLNDYPFLVVAIGDNQKRLALSLKYQTQGFTLATIIHPAASVSHFAQVGPGTVVFAQAVINIDAVIGNACIINSGAIVEHDCQLDDGVHLSPHASLGGQVQVGKHSWLGIGCSVIHQKMIGQNCVIGAGAVVIRDVTHGQTVVGNPAHCHNPRFGS